MAYIYLRAPGLCARFRHMSDPYFFGYGSLVNRRTHAYESAHRATVTGWRRAWRHFPVRAISFLTVVPDEDTAIRGLIARVPDADWSGLDERERAYDRHDVGSRISHDAGGRLAVSIYAIPEGRHLRPGDDNPVLLSYIDTVAQGFLAEYGEIGLSEFFDTTDGWRDAPVLNDRAAPVYGRHQPTSAREKELVDMHLARVRARVVGP